MARDCMKLVGDEWRYFLNGREVGRKEYEKLYPPPKPSDGIPGGHLPGAWPMASEGLAVHPRQRKQAMQMAQDRGVPTHFDRHGRPVFRDRNHRKRYLQAFQKFDKDAGYSDQARQTRYDPSEEDAQLKKEWDEIAGLTGTPVGSQDRAEFIREMQRVGCQV